MTNLMFNAFHMQRHSKCSPYAYENTWLHLINYLLIHDLIQ